MASQGWVLPLLVLGTGAFALVPVARPSNQESLRSALDAVARKQRSLDAVDYNDLHSFKYHGGDADRKFDRDLDEEDEEIEFLPGDNGQLETVGDGFQGLHDKLLERALFDYLESMPEQEEPVASIFRERERSSSRKRAGSGDRMNIDNKVLAKMILGESLDGSPYGSEMEDSDNYLTALQTFYDRYRAGRGNKVYETTGPMSWGELANKGSPMKDQTRDDNEFVGHDQDQSILYLTPAERRNVNGRYPIGREFGGYRKFSKRYPVAKRSPRPTQAKLKTTDPKVVQDLGALFGTQSTDAHNRTYKSEQDHNHDHAHDHDHDHNHDHMHDHDQDHVHDHGHDHEGRTSDTPLNTTSTPKSQKENATKAAKSKFVQVRKKSVDWSQYFGIDRRKKKATFMAGQGTQNQDDEWILQRYYENMAENLKSKEDESERKDKLEQMDSKLKYIKDMIIEEALRYANLEDETDLQKVKDKLMARMAAAYSLQKMRKALSDLKNNVAAQKEMQRIQKETQNNLTSNYRDNGHGNINGNSGSNDRIDEKRSGINSNIDDGETVEEARGCPEFKTIEWRCKTDLDKLPGDTSQLFIPCVNLQICKACAQDEEGLLPCISNYAMEAGTVCDMLDSRERQIGGSSRFGPSRHEESQSCADAAVLLFQLQPRATTTVQCRNGPQGTCLVALAEELTSWSDVDSVPESRHTNWHTNLGTT